MSTGGHRDWRGGKRRRETDVPSETAPAWKQSRQPVAAAVPRGRRKNRAKIILPVLLLIVLVAVAIWLRLIARPHYTHAVVFNPLLESELFSAGVSPEFPATEEGMYAIRRTTHSTLRDFSLSEKVLTDEGASQVSGVLDARHTVVVYLQTVMLPDAQTGSWRCLIGNSNYDLDQPDKYVELSVLKERLQDFRSRNPDCGLLLLVDLPAPNHESRLGWVPSGAADEIASWTSDVDRLVVVASATGPDPGVFAGIGSGGRTAFARLTDHAFSKAADFNQDGQVLVAEFCRFLVDETREWVRQHRRSTGQVVSVTPSLEQLQTDDLRRNFVVVKSPAEPRKENPPAARSDLEQQIGDLWLRQEALIPRLGFRWNPLAWRAATHTLLLAEGAFLKGRFDECELRIRKASDWLTLVESDTRAVVEGGLNAQRSLPREWFVSLPVLPRLESLWDESGAAETESEKAAAAEDVLRSQLDQYPFAEIGIAVPAEDVKERVLRSRADTEQAAAETPGACSRLRETLLQLEARQLAEEDQLFVLPGNGGGGTSGPGTSAVADAAGLFAVEYQQALTSSRSAMEVIPAAVAWAASARPLWGHGDNPDWTALLMENRADVVPTSEFVSNQVAKISRLNQVVEPTWEGSAIRLRAAVLRLVTQARGLLHVLEVAEPAGGYALDSLKRDTEQLTASRTACDQTLDSVRQLSQELADGILQKKPQQREDRIAQYQRAGGLLMLTTLSAAQRRAVLQRLRELDTELAAPVDAQSDKVAEPGEAASGASGDSRTLQAFLWTGQVLNLLPGTGADPHPAADFWTVVAQRQSAVDEAARHRLDAELGATVRAAWAKARLRVDSSLASDAEQILSRLSAADRTSRLLSVVDAELLRPDLRNPTRVHDALLQMEYCLLQAERSVLNRWVDTGDRPPYHEHSWYANQTNSYLAEADRLAGRMETDGVVAAAALRQQVAAVRSRLRDSDRLRVTAESAVGEIDLGEQNVDRRPAGVTVRIEGSGDAAGTASASLLPVAGIRTDRLLQVEQNAVPVSLTEASTELSFTIARIGNPKEGNCQSSAWLPGVFFRGRTWKSDQRVTASPCAGTSWVTEYLARPEGASIVLSDTDSRPIAFVLDWSGSMSKATSTDGAKIKSVEAMQTLRDVIADLEETRKVSLRVFGHRVKYDSSEPDPHVPNPDFVPAFGPRYSIDPQLQANDDVQLLMRTSRLNDDAQFQFNDFLKKLEQSKPYGITPLVKAVTDSLQQDLDNGSGIIIVITDGEATDATQSRLATLYRAMKAVRNTARLVIVAFDLRGVADGGQQQRDAIRTLFDVPDSLPTSVVDAGNSEELKTVITSSFDPRQYAVRRDSFRNQVYPPENLNQPITGLSKGSDYVLEFAGVSTQSHGLISLDRGDALQVRIDWKIPQFVFDRRSAPQRSVGVTGAEGVSPVTPVMLQAVQDAVYSRFRDTDNLRMAHVELSLMLNHPREDLPVAQPAEVNFEFHAPDGIEYRPGSIRQTFTSEWGAPGWKVLLNEWPDRYDVEVTAAWKMEPTPPDDTRSWTDLRERQRPENSLRIGGGTSALPDAGVWVSLRPGGSLQVRLDPTPGQPASPQNPVDGVTVAVGRRDTFESNQRFVADEVMTTVTRFEKGSVVFEFFGNYTEESLTSREIAFTSASSRQSGVMRTRQPLRPGRIRQ